MKEKYQQIASDSKDVVRYLINEQMELLPFLLSALSHRGRNSVKSILARGQVQVDDYIITKYNYTLLPDHVVTIQKNKAAVKENRLIGLQILHQDDDVIVVHKDAGLLSVAVDKKKQLTAHGQLMEYVRQEDNANRVFVVHRLDRDTSGVMMFAKNARAKSILQNEWQDLAKERTYIAFVEGDVKQEKGVFTSWLKENQAHYVYSSQKKDEGLLAVTHYEKIQSNQKFTLLEVELETGRKNQIRVHMLDLGHPVVGDKKYGSKSKVLGRLGLHAKVLAFIHPVTKQLMRFEVDAPDIFYKKSR